MVCKAGVEPAVFQTRSTAVELRESNPKQAVARAFTVSPLAHNLVRGGRFELLACQPILFLGSNGFTDRRSEHPPYFYSGLNLYSTPTTTAILFSPSTTSTAGATNTEQFSFSSLPARTNGMIGAS